MKTADSDIIQLLREIKAGGGGGGGGAPSGAAAGRLSGNYPNPEVTNVPRWYNVKDYGAVGDGSTDDLAAIAATITAIPAAGGTLYFPPGQYKTSAGFTLSKPITVRGDGGSTSEITNNAITQINCTSATAILFSVTSEGCSVRDISLKNTAGTTPTAGAAITISATVNIGDLFRVDNVKVWRFYDNIDIQSGQQWSIDHSYIIEPVRYGIRIRDVNLPDGGDWSISNTTIISYTATQASGSAGIRYETGSAGKITNVKINGSTTNSTWFDYGISIAPGFGNLFLLVSNCSIENFTSGGIVATDGMLSLQVSNCQFGDNVAPFNSPIALAYSSETYKNVAITGCVFKAPSSSAFAAITMDHVVAGTVTGNTQTNFVQLLSTATSDVTQSPLVRTATPSGGVITFSSIPPGFKRLRISFSGRSDVAANSTSLKVTLNGDTGNNYHHNELYTYGTAAPANNNGTTTAVAFMQMLGAGIPGATATANRAGTGTIEIADYAGTTFNKAASMRGATFVEGTGGLFTMGGGYWFSTAAITSVTLTPTAGNLITGSTATLTLE